MQSIAEPADSIKLTQLQRELAKNEHQLSELEVILADYDEERSRLIRDISRLQTQLRDMKEQRQSVFPPGDVESHQERNDL